MNSQRYIANRHLGFEAYYKPICGDDLSAKQMHRKCAPKYAPNILDGNSTDLGIDEGTLNFEAKDYASGLDCWWLLRNTEQTCGTSSVVAVEFTRFLTQPTDYISIYDGNSDDACKFIRAIYVFHTETHVVAYGHYF